MASDEQSEGKDNKRVTTADVHSEKAGFIPFSGLDTGAKLAAGAHGPLDSVEAQRIRCVHLKVCMAVRVLTSLHQP